MHNNQINLMQIKIYLLLALLLTSTLSEVVSLASILSRPKLPTPTLPLPVPPQPPVRPIVPPLTSVLTSSLPRVSTTTTPTPTIPVGISTLVPNISTIRTTVSVKDILDNTFDQKPQCDSAGRCSSARTFSNQNQLNNFVKKYFPAPSQDVIRPGGPRPAFQPIALPAFSPTRVDSLMERRIAPSIAPTTTTTSGASAQKIIFSGTNNQQQNVDEADLLKTDGYYIYTITDRVLSIVKSNPANQSKVVSTINLDKYPRALFIHEDVLAVFGSQSSFGGYRGRGFYYAWDSATFIFIYNIKNRAKPVLLNSLQVSGDYFDGRKLQNGFIYLINKQSMHYTVNIPWYNLGSGKTICPYNWVYYYTTFKYQNPAFINVISIDLNNPTSSFTIRSFIGQNSHMLYMSQRNIYLVANKYSTDSTAIAKIYVNGNTIMPVADVDLPGQVNNQFSLSEYQGFLRVATTVNLNKGQSNWSNNVYVLTKYLNIYGQILNIAKTQKIYACRYAKNRLYMVTFRQVDPFFVISFRNPKKPTVLGQLKIPGFSRFLYPFNDQTIIGIGRNTKLNEYGNVIQLGLKIALYDVTNPTKPSETAAFELQQKYASSSAEWEHKAFLLAPQKNLMAIPASLQDGKTNFRGIFVFNVDQSSIELKGTVNHLNGDNDPLRYRRDVERSLYIEDPESDEFFSTHLFSKSPCQIKINDLQHLDEIRSVPLQCTN